MSWFRAANTPTAKRLICIESVFQTHSRGSAVVSVTAGAGRAQKTIACLVTGALEESSRNSPHDRSAPVDGSGSAWSALRVSYRIFAQATDYRIDAALLVRHAQKFFEASIDVLGYREDPEGHELRVRIDSARRGFSEALAVKSRRTLPEDWEAAARAETRGRATGMSALALRCAHVWEVRSSATSSEPALLSLCALLASVALGPVMPDDESTLFGVRGAMERVDALTGASLLR